MLSREDRILSEILVSRGLVERERLEACAKRRRDPASSLVDALIDDGELSRDQAREVADEARSLDESLAPEFSAGKRLGEFRLLRELGRGGMGIVYEAEQEPLGRRVALKVLPGGAALDERLAIRFLREARAAGRLTHPGIVSVYTSGQAEGVLYFAMELIEGQTLAGLVSAGPLDPLEAARIAAEVARALDHAHAQGLVHRDVKPENVLIARDGRAKVADFGLVFEPSAGPFTLTRHVLGTPAYIAPEQARGECVDARSDIYGLGAVLYFLLGGVPPFAGEVPSLVLARALTERPRDLLEIRPGLPGRLVAICERAMARDPTARYASAAAMAEDLESFLDGGLAEPDPLQPEPLARTRARGWMGARGASLALLAAVALVAAGLPVARRLLVEQGAKPATSDEAGTVSFHQVLAPAGRKTSPTLSPDGEWLAYSSDADGDSDIYLLGRTGEEPINLTPDSPAHDVSPAYSPDGRSIAFVRLGQKIGQSSMVRILDLATREVKDVLERTASGLAWSSDGREILFADRMVDSPGTNAASSKLFGVEVSTGKLRVLTGLYGSQPSASRRGAIAFVSPGGEWTDLWSLPETGGDAVRLTDDDALEWSPAWSHDGTALYFGGDRDGPGGLYRVPTDQRTGAPIGVPTTISSAIFPQPFYLTSGGTEGDELALIHTEHDGMLYRLELSEPPHERIERVVALPGRFLAAMSPDLSPDGTQLTFTAVTSREDLAIGGAKGEHPRFLTHDEFRDRAPRFSPDGSRIAFHSDRSGNMEIWTIRPDGQDLARRTWTRGDATFPVWSPDGTRLAFAVEGNGAFLTSADARAEGGAAQPLPAPEDGIPFEPSSWSPDGRAIAGTARGVVIYSIANGSYRRLTDFGAVPVWLDPRRLAFTTEREVRLLDSRSGDSRSLFSFVPATLSRSLGASVNGRILVVSLFTSAEEVWRVEIKE